LCLAMRNKRTDCYCYPFAQAALGAKAEVTLRLADIETAARLTIGLRGIPIDAASKANLGGDHLRQVANRNFLSATKIHGLATIVTLRCQHDAIGGIVHIKKFPSRRTIAPKNYLLVVVFFSFDTLAYQCRNDV